MSIEVYLERVLDVLQKEILPTKHLLPCLPQKGEIIIYQNKRYMVEQLIWNFDKEIPYVRVVISYFDNFSQDEDRSLEKDLRRQK